MPDLSRKTASIYINQAPAEEALKKLQTQSDKLTASIKKGQDAGKAMVGEIAKLNTTKEQIAGVQRQIDSGLKPSFNQLQTLVAKTRAELKKMSESDPGFAQKTKDLNKYSTEMSRLGTQIGAVKKESGGIKGMIGDMLPGIGVAAAGAAVIGFLKGAVTEALEADKALGKFKGTLDNLGKGESFDRLAGKAEAMAKRFKFLDSPDIIGVFDKLITYGKLSEAQIDKLTPVIVNFSVKSKISLDESASIIIKALEGNGKALKEYGINIKDAKTESERLAIVMSELGNKVNGAADAFGETTAGKIAETQQSMKDLKEEIGTGLLPMIKSTLSWFRDLINELNGITIAVKKMQDVGFAKVFSRVGEGLGALITGGPEKLRKLNEMRQAAENAGAKMNDIAEGIATEVGGKTIKEQQVLADAYKNLFINARKELAEFMNSADKDDKERGDKLRAQVEQKGKIFLSTQRTLNEAIAVDKKNSQKESEKSDDQADKEADRKREAAMKKAIEEAKRLQKVWEDLTSRINDPFALMANDPVAQAFKKANDQASKDISTAKNLLDKRVIDYKTYSDAIVRVEEIRMKELKDIAEKYKIQLGDSTYRPGIATPLAKPVTGGALADNKNANQQLIKDQDTLFQNSLAKEQLKAITSHGKKKLEAELNILDLQEVAEINSKGVTEDKKLLIEEEYRQKRLEAEKNHNLEIAQTILDAAQGVANIFALMDSANQAANAAKLEQNQKVYDDDKEKLDRNLRQKLISQKEHDRQMNQLDEKKRKADAAIKKKEFEANKRQQIIQAIMSGAQAVVSTLAARPGPLDLATLGAARLIQIGLAVAATTAQVATISAQKPPEYATGGLLNGPSHSSGGMPVIDPRTGKKVAEVEGGEPILSRKTYSNNRGLIDQLLRASMYGNGARITPYWENRSSYNPMNYGGINRSLTTIKYFEKGGVMPGNKSMAITNETDFAKMLLGSIDRLNGSVDGLNVSVDGLNVSVDAMNERPVEAYMVLSKFEATQAAMDVIRRETTMTRDKNRLS